MARRRISYRKKHQNLFSMFLVSVVVLMITITVAVKSTELNEKIEYYTAREKELLVKKAEEQAREQEIQEYATYIQTKQFAEEVAKDKLGLVYEGEILFKEED